MFWRGPSCVASNRSKTSRRDGAETVRPHVGGTKRTKSSTLEEKDKKRDEKCSQSRDYGVKNISHYSGRPGSRPGWRPVSVWRERRVAVGVARRPWRRAAWTADRFALRPLSKHTNRIWPRLLRDSRGPSRKTAFRVGYRTSQRTQASRQGRRGPAATRVGWPWQRRKVMRHKPSASLRPLYIQEVVRTNRI